MEKAYKKGRRNGMVKRKKLCGKCVSNACKIAPKKGSEPTWQMPAKSASKSWENCVENGSKMRGKLRLEKVCKRG